MAGPWNYIIKRKRVYEATRFDNINLRSSVRSEILITQRINPVANNSVIIFNTIRLLFLITAARTDVILISAYFYSIQKAGSVV